MIDGARPGPERVDPVGQAPAEVVRLAERCERLEAVAEAAREYRAAENERPGSAGWRETLGLAARRLRARDALDAALVAAGATGKAGT